MIKKETLSYLIELLRLRSTVLSDRNIFAKEHSIQEELKAELNLNEYEQELTQSNNISDKLALQIRLKMKDMGMDPDGGGTPPSMGDYFRPKQATVETLDQLLVNEIAANLGLAEVHLCSGGCGALLSGESAECRACGMARRLQQAEGWENAPDPLEQLRVVAQVFGPVK